MSAKFNGENPKRPQSRPLVTTVSGASPGRRDDRRLEERAREITAEQPRGVGSERRCKRVAEASETPSRTRDAAVEAPARRPDGRRWRKEWHVEEAGSSG